jgi:hypothetical protein
MTVLPLHRLAARPRRRATLPRHLALYIHAGLGWFSVPDVEKCS